MSLTSILIMLKRLKNALNGIAFAWQYGDIIRSFTTAWSRYPGVDSSEDLKEWVRPLLLDVATLTALTPTPIDDVVVFAAIRLVDSRQAWTAIHSLVLLSRDGCFTDGVLIPQSQQVAATSDLFDSILSETPDDPVTVQSAVGLLLYLLHKRKRWSQ